MVDKEDRNEFYSSVYLSLRRFLFGVSIMIICLLPFVFNILVNSKYSESYIYIPLMVISVYYSNLSSFSSGIFSAYKDTKILAPTTVFAAIVNILINFLLINKIGLFAPILGTFTAYFIINIYRNYYLKKYIVLPKDEFMPINLFILAILCYIYYSNNTILYILGLLIGLGYSYWINKDFIKKIFRKENFRRKRNS